MVMYALRPSPGLRSKRSPLTLQEQRDGGRSGTYASCQGTKSLRDSLLPDGLRIIPRGEIVGSGGSALS